MAEVVGFILAKLDQTKALCLAAMQIGTAGTELYWIYFKPAVNADEFHTIIEFLIKRKKSKKTRAHEEGFVDMWIFVFSSLPLKTSLSGENIDLKWNQLIRLDGGGLKYERKPSWTFGWWDS